MANMDQVASEASAAARPTWQRWLRLRGGWLIAALFCVTLAGALAVLLPLRAEIDRPSIFPDDWHWWIEPGETNSFARRTVIKSNLIDIAIAPIGRTALAVEEHGTLLRSVDAGISWQTIPLENNALLTSVAIAMDGRTVLAVGRNGVLLRSADAGFSWEAVTSSTQQTLVGVRFSQDGSTALAVGARGTLVRSTNAGSSWQTVQTGTQETLWRVAIAQDNRSAVAVGERGTLLHSLDAGSSWRSIATEMRKDLFDVAIAPDGRTALAVGLEGTLLRSIDAGVSWESERSRTQETLFGVAIAPDGRTALAVGTKGALLRSADIGRTWVTDAVVGTARDLFRVAFAPDGRTVLAVGERGTLLRTTDAGSSWRSITAGAQQHLLGVTFSPDGRTALAVGERGTLLRSADAGLSWQAVASNKVQDLQSVTIAPNGRTTLAVGLGGTLLGSADAGASWQAVSAGPPMSLLGVTIAPNGRTALVVRQEGTIMRSVDAGASWQAVETGTETELRSIAIAPDGRTALAVGEAVILRSSDAGTSWQRPAGSYILNLRSVAITPGGRTALAVGDGALLRSSDAGLSWQIENTDAFLRSIAIAPEGRIAIAVGERGTLLRSIDSGVSWEAVSTGTELNLRAAAIASDGRIALVVGEQGTLLRSIDSGLSWRHVHRRHPAPIVWALLIVAFVVSAPLFLPLPRERYNPTTMSLSDLFATDRPLQPGEADAAGAAPLAERLGRFLINRNTQPPLTLAITGDWGSGKSSVLNLLAAELKRSGRRPVWFNAWHHQKEEHIFAALLQAVRNQAVPPLTSSAGLSVRRRLAWSRIRRHWALWLGALVAIAGLIGAMSAMEFKELKEAWGAVLAPTGLVGISLVLLREFRDRLKSADLNPGKLMAAAAGVTRWRDLGGQLAFRVRFAEALREVTTALENTNLTVIIDDLDRCDPRAVAEVMEAINFLTSSSDCFVVLAVARTQVLKAMGLAHAKMAKEMAPEGMTDERTIRDHYAQRYLDKLIQIEMPVPRFDAAAAQRLTRSATRLRNAPPDRGWVAPLAAVGVVCVLGAAGFGGFFSGRMLQPMSQVTAATTTAASITTSAATPAQVTSAPVPSEPMQAIPSQQDDRFVAIEYREPGSPWWDSSLLLLTIPLFLVGVAARIRRTNAMDEEDAPAFAAALAHWSEAAFLARPTPRELKRFLNRLRLTATDLAVPADATTVGLAVLAHADLEAVETAASRGVDPMQAAFERHTVKSQPALRAEIEHAARTISDIGAPPFAPKTDEIRAFLAAWTGFTIRA